METLSIGDNSRFLPSPAVAHYCYDDDSDLGVVVEEEEQGVLVGLLIIVAVVLEVRLLS